MPLTTNHRRVAQIFFRCRGDGPPEPPIRALQCAPSLSPQPTRRQARRQSDDGDGLHGTCDEKGKRGRVCGGRKGGERVELAPTARVRARAPDCLAIFSRLLPRIHHPVHGHHRRLRTGAGARAGGGKQQAAAPAALRLANAGAGEVETPRRPARFFGPPRTHGIACKFPTYREGKGDDPKKVARLSSKEKKGVKRAL